MSSAAAPPTPARHSRLWYIAVISLVVVVCLAGLFGTVHLYSLYAMSLSPTQTRQHAVEKSGQPPKPKSEKGSSATHEKAPTATGL